MGLALSSQQNRDAALLRATTDLFVQTARHDQDEIRRFEELALHFLTKVGPSDRAYVADALAPREDAPHAVILQLARDLIEVAAPVLRRSPVLRQIDLIVIIAATGPLHHRLIAGRANLPKDVVSALRRVGDAATLQALETGPQEPLPQPSGRVELVPRRRLDPTPVTLPVEPRAAPASPPVSDDFLRLDSMDRLRLIAAAAERQRRRPSLAARLDQEVRRTFHAARIVNAARKGERDKLVTAFAEGLGLDEDFVTRVIEDTSGEGLVLICKAAGLNDAEAGQVLLLANPVIGRSVNTFLRLADLHAGMDVGTAMDVIDEWRASGRRPSGHQPHYDEGGDRPRRQPAVEERRAPAIAPPVRSTGRL